MASTRRSSKATATPEPTTTAAPPDPGPTLAGALPIWVDADGASVTRDEGGDGIPVGDGFALVIVDDPDSPEAAAVEKRLSRYPRVTTVHGRVVYIGTDDTRLRFRGRGFVFDSTAKLARLEGEYRDGELLPLTPNTL